MRLTVLKMAFCGLVGLLFVLACIVAYCTGFAT